MKCNHSSLCLLLNHMKHGLTRIIFISSQQREICETVDKPSLRADHPLLEEMNLFLHIFSSQADFLTLDAAVDFKKVLKSVFYIFHVKLI